VITRSEEEIHKYRLIQQKRKEDKQQKRNLFTKQMALKQSQSGGSARPKQELSPFSSNIIQPTVTAPHIITPEPPPKASSGFSALAEVSGDLQFDAVFERFL
jgi:hypothetical protein